MFSKCQCVEFSFMAYNIFFHPMIQISRSFYLLLRFSIWRTLCCKESILLESHISRFTWTSFLLACIISCHFVSLFVCWFETLLENMSIYSCVTNLYFSVTFKNWKFLIFDKLASNILLLVDDFVYFFDRCKMLIKYIPISCMFSCLFYKKK